MKYFEIWEVKDCPHCGSSAVCVQDMSHHCNKPTYNVKCRYCGYIVTADTAKKAIKTWNEAKYDGA